jgi:hypothetical protein
VALADRRSVHRRQKSCFLKWLADSSQEDLSNNQPVRLAWVNTVFQPKFSVGRWCQAFVLTFCFTLAIAAEQAPDNFQVLSVAQLILHRMILVRELVRLANIPDIITEALVLKRFPEIDPPVDRRDRPWSWCDGAEHAIRFAPWMKTR